MVSNTFAFYKVAKKFQDNRAEMVSEYEGKIQSMEPYKGSSGYDKQVAELTEKHEEGLKALQDKCRKELLIIMDGMDKAIDKRRINPPSNEQLNLIHLLKMREKVTEEELDRVAEMVRDNGIALGVVQEIAHENEIMKNYTSLCTEMSSGMAHDVIKGMRAGLEDWILFDTGKAGRMANRYNFELYGTPERVLPKRPLFHTEEECFKELAGLNSEHMKLFRDIVDAQQQEGGNHG